MTKVLVRSYVYPAPGPLRNTLLLRTTCMRSQLLGRVGGVAAVVTYKQTKCVPELRYTADCHLG